MILFCLIPCSKLCLPVSLSSLEFSQNKDFMDYTFSILPFLQISWYFLCKKGKKKDTVAFKKKTTRSVLSVTIVNNQALHTCKFLEQIVCILTTQTHIHTQNSQHEVIDVLIILISVIIPQGICKSNHHGIYFRYKQLYSSIIPQ